MANVLIVDDEEQVRDLLRSFLLRKGHDVRDASDGGAALKLHRQSPADLIILDLIMPNKEGLQTIVDLRKEFPDTKIIAISGGGGSGDPNSYLSMAVNLGASLAIAKPFGLEELGESLKATLNS